MLDPVALAPERLRPLAVVEYMQLVELGAFDDENVELLRGQLVTMSPQGAPHAYLTAWLTRRFTLVLGARFLPRSHSPFWATEDSMPEPDVIVALDGDRGHPRRASLIIEVAQSSLRKDRIVKAPIYAEAGVPEYWIVDVDARVVHVFTRPTPGGYESEACLGSGDVLRPVELPEVAISVDELPFEE